jgi:hypothetical protein
MSVSGVSNKAYEKYSIDVPYAARGPKITSAPPHLCYNVSLLWYFTRDS